MNGRFSEKDKKKIKLQSLLEYLCKSVCTHFDACFPPGNLKNILQTNRHRFERRLNDEQKENVFPTNGSDPLSANFDITLQICLIRNIPNKTIPPRKGYDSLPNANDISIADDLARIKHYRNYVAHVVSDNISKQKFEEIWKILSEVALRRDKSIKKGLEKLKTMEIGNDSMTYYKGIATGIAISSGILSTFFILYNKFTTDFDEKSEKSSNLVKLQDEKTPADSKDTFEDNDFTDCTNTMKEIESQSKGNPMKGTEYIDILDNSEGGNSVQIACYTQHERKVNILKCISEYSPEFPEFDNYRDSMVIMSEKLYLPDKPQFQTVIKKTPHKQDIRNQWCIQIATRDDECTRRCIIFLKSYNTYYVQNECRLLTICNRVDKYVTSYVRNESRSLTICSRRSLYGFCNVGNESRSFTICSRCSLYGFSNVENESRSLTICSRCSRYGFCNVGNESRSLTICSRCSLYGFSNVGNESRSLTICSRCSRYGFCNVGNESRSLTICSRCSLDGFYNVGNERRSIFNRVENDAEPSLSDICMVKPYFPKIHSGIISRHPEISGCNSGSLPRLYGELPPLSRNRSNNTYPVWSFVLQMATYLFLFMFGSQAIKTITNRLLE